MSTETLPDNEYRFTWGAWVTLLVTFFWLIVMPASLFISYSYPSDGWSIDSPTFILKHNLANTPSPLQAGDQVIAIVGQAVDIEHIPSLALDRQAGQILRYTVLRNGQSVEVDVPLVRLSPLAYIRTLANNLAGEWLFSLSMLLSLGVAAYVFFRQPGNLAARYLLLIFSYAFSVSSFGVYSAVYSHSYPLLLSAWNDLSGSSPFWFFFPSWILFLLIFPVRKWPMQRFPRGLPILVYGFWPLGSLAKLDSVLVIGSALAFLLTLFITLIHNWLTVRDVIQRAQVRWLTLGLGLGWGGGFTLGISGVLLNIPWLSAIGFALTVLFPVSLAFAILRYRLFDIDLIIRRTVLWAIISGLGLGVYLLAVGATSFFLGSQPDYVIPLVALMLVALVARPLYRQLEIGLERLWPSNKETSDDQN